MMMMMMLKMRSPVMMMMEHNQCLSGPGSAAAVLMSVSGMEKLMNAGFFKSENVTEIYSDIITATLPKTKHKELPEPVNFTVYHKKVQNWAGLVTCVYWQEQGEETHWSVDGCTASFSNENYTVCSCTHLSTFAILLQTEEQEEDSSLLEAVNLFCMCVGLAFLALAILTFLLCTWNPKINNTARLHLCICLFLGHLLFLVGVSRSENAVVCAVIAGTLHFLFLSGFVWMLLETLQLFLLVRSLSKVQVIQKEGLRALYLLLIGYGAPLVVVGVSAAVFSDGYGSKDSCWLSTDRNFRWSFIGPVCAIISLNCISFCVILWTLQPTLANMKSDVSQSRDTRLIVFKIVAQFLILGCTWILGFFQSSTMLKYLFIILNSQQGTFIFIVHCLLNKEVREEYKRWFSCLFRRKEPSGSRGSPNSVATVQK
ncbi:adhesion G protein-coupled receptor E3-like [Conger conger]|uniref:adhesion G protein-coupled receptor E3-like n=1 Tax=Conger conger TaxID=82655 RepID=UPI002A5ABEAB|nr:adhesion G protein-coupled receptor E3-like [Conger conger]